MRSLLWLEARTFFWGAWLPCVAAFFAGVSPLRFVWSREADAHGMFSVLVLLASPFVALRAAADARTVRFVLPVSPVRWFAGHLGLFLLASAPPAFVAAALQRWEGRWADVNVLFASLLLLAWVLYALAELYMWYAERWRSPVRVAVMTAVAAVVGVGALLLVTRPSLLPTCALVVPLVASLFRVERDRELVPSPPPDRRSGRVLASDAGGPGHRVAWSPPRTIYGSRPAWTLLRAMYGGRRLLVWVAVGLFTFSFESALRVAYLVVAIRAWILPGALDSWSSFTATPFPRSRAHAVVLVPLLVALAGGFAASDLVFSDPERVFVGREGPHALDCPYWMRRAPESLERFLDLRTARDRREVAERVSRYVDVVYAIEASPDRLLALERPSGNAGEGARESWLAAIESSYADRIGEAMLRRRAFELIFLFFCVLVCFNFLTTESDRPRRWARIAGWSLLVLFLADCIWHPITRDGLFPTTVVHEFCRFLELHPWAVLVWVALLVALYYRSRRVLV